MSLAQLNTELKTYKKEIHSDSYPVSIGEIMNMYRDEELDIHPEFQRVYRWSNEQKSKFIESILLGIPLPSFFVSQRNDGVWDVIDGLQRLSTIFEFMGELKDANGEKLPPLVINNTNLTYLSALNGARWDNERTISQSIKLDFKRAKLDFKIIKKESTRDAKYELFQRLNTGGSNLSDQEIRNCLLLMVNKKFYDWMQSLAKNKDFVDCSPLSDNQKEQAYDLELISRFIVFFLCDWLKNTAPSTIGDIGDFLNDKIVSFAQDKNFKYDKIHSIFEKTFKCINLALGEDAFRKYDAHKRKHSGALSIAAFETIAIGVAKNIKHFDATDKKSIKILYDRVLGLHKEQVLKNNSGSGITASMRVAKLLPFSIEYFGGKL